MSYPASLTSTYRTQKAEQGRCIFKYITCTCRHCVHLITTLYYTLLLLLHYHIFTSTIFIVISIVMLDPTGKEHNRNVQIDMSLLYSCCVYCKKI